MQDLTKNHVTRLEISKDALLHNLNYYKSIVPAKTKVLVMIKSNAYGTGDVELAQFMQESGVNYLGVANSGEALTLRKAKINLPILVLNSHSGSYNEIIENQIEPSMYNFKVLNELLTILKQKKQHPYPIHIKIDTGMNRLGFKEVDINPLIALLKNSLLVKVVSIFSHLAGADEACFDTFTREQITLFDRLALEIESRLGYKPMKHILNSAGAERFTDASFDMIRLGIGMYGFSSNNQVKLKNVSTLKSKIMQIKDVLPSDTIGYSRKGKLTKKGKIAIVGAGYGDGVPRAIGDSDFKVLVNNMLVPIIGNVCMDMCIIDISEIEAKEGDDVIFFGEENPATEISAKLNTISYEIITNITRRVKRTLI